jgi:hypothetical protein
MMKKLAGLVYTYTDTYIQSRYAYICFVSYSLAYASYVRLWQRENNLYYKSFKTMNHHAAILIIVEVHETAFNVFQYQFTTGKPFRSLKLTLNYYENGSR